MNIKRNNIVRTDMEQVPFSVTNYIHFIKERQHEVEQEDVGEQSKRQVFEDTRQRQMYEIKKQSDPDYGVFKQYQLMPTTSPMMDYNYWYSDKTTDQKNEEINKLRVENEMLKKALANEFE